MAAQSGVGSREADTPTLTQPIVEQGSSSTVLRFSVGLDHAGSRLDKALAVLVRASHPELSRTRLQQMIAAGLVRIDGRGTGDAGAKVVAGMDIVLVRPEPTDAVPEAQSIPLAIVFEDPHLLVLDKPAGLVVHPAAGHADGTLVNALLAHCADEQTMIDARLGGSGVDVIFRRAE